MTTIPAMFIETCKRFKGSTTAVAFSSRKDGVWHHHSHDELLADVAAFASGMFAIGIRPGERVGIVSENRTEWAICDYALAGAGIIDVPVFPTLTPAQLAQIFNDCEASAVVVSNEAQLRKIVEQWPQMPSLRHVITMNNVVSNDSRVLRMQDVMDRSRVATPLPVLIQQYEEMGARVRSEDVLTLIYTSGTTGDPKGVVLTHGNLIANIQAGLRRIAINGSDVFLSYLPLCHSYERMSGYYLAFSAGAHVFIAESIESVAELMREVRPTVMTSVPRLFERIRARVVGSVTREPAWKQRLFAWAFTVAERANGKDQKIGDGGRMIIADRLVFSKIRARTGGRLRFFVSGGAALDHTVGAFFAAVGIPIVEGYGLTESSPVIAVHKLEDIVLGTVGPPLDNVIVRIAEDGEILAKGPSIMKGYWNNPKATQESVSPDGWLYTGDIGHLDERGHLVITDRKKNLFVSSGGKNIAPQPIEALLVQSPLIDQIMLVGDGREYCTALVVPDREAVAEWRKSNPEAELFTAIETEINKRQRNLAKYERVRRFRLIDDAFTTDNGMLTPTMKIKRKAVLAAYADVIEDLYAGKR